MATIAQTTIRGFFKWGKEGLAGPFRTDEDRFRAAGDTYYKATMVLEEIPTIHPLKKKTVWQWRYRDKGMPWYVDQALFTETEVLTEYAEMDQYDKHAGPFEVPE